MAFGVRKFSVVGLVNKCETGKSIFSFSVVENKSSLMENPDVNRSILKEP